MKYKLIREYPTSPILGTVIEYDKEADVYCNHEIGYFLSKSEIDKFPMFWMVDDFAVRLATKKVKRYTDFHLNPLHKHWDGNFQAYCIDSDEYRGRTFLLTLERPDDFDPIQVRVLNIMDVSDVWTEFCRTVRPKHIEIPLSFKTPDDWKNFEFFDLEYYPLTTPK